MEGEEEEARAETTINNKMQTTPKKNRHLPRQKEQEEDGVPKQEAETIGM
jgi:hypothetical protein